MLEWRTRRVKHQVLNARSGIRPRRFQISLSGKLNNRRDHALGQPLRLQIRGWVWISTDQYHVVVEAAGTVLIVLVA